MSQRILIIEDHADIRRLIRMTLEFEDHDIHEAANADEGWAAMQQLRPQLLLLDVMMPGSMDGLDLCRRVKSESHGGAAPKDAELDLALSTGGKLLNRLAQPQRGGEFHYGEVTLRVTTELLGGLTISNGQTSDYLIARPDGTPVAAVRKTGLQPTVYLPKAPGPERDAAAVLALSLIFFNDPGNTR